MYLGFHPGSWLTRVSSVSLCCQERGTVSLYLCRLVSLSMPSCFHVDFGTTYGHAVTLQGFKLERLRNKILEGSNNYHRVVPRAALRWFFLTTLLPKIRIFRAVYCQNFPRQHVPRRAHTKELLFRDYLFICRQKSFNSCSL